MNATSARLREANIGARVAAARRGSGMTQRDLAQALGISSWTVDSIERGVVDPGRFLPSIAEVTHASGALFTGPAEDVARPRERGVVLPHLGVAGRNLVLGSIVVLVTIRFFTEVVPVIPRAANFVDIPIFLVLALAAMALPPFPRRPKNYVHVALPGIAFLLLAVLSAMVNSGRAQPAPVLVFVYGFLAPFGVYAAAYRIWPPGHGRSLSRVLVGLGLIQLVVVAFISIPRFIAAGGNPDFISGTFGTNQYQLVFFLLVVAALLAGIFTLEPERAVARFIPVIILAIFGTMLLAQYRALLLTTIVTIVVVGVLLGRHIRGVLFSLVAIVGFAIMFSFVASSYPILKLDETASTLSRSPWVYAAERYDATLPVRQLYRDDPYVGAVGTGPGTFSSRAWQTFSQADSRSHANVQGGYAERLTGGLYSTDVSDRYVVSQVDNGGLLEGSAALSKPYSSYLGLVAEVGLLGLALIVVTYVLALLRVGRIARTEIVKAAGRSDPLPALALATTIGLLTLLQMGFLENWLEVTRITFIVWMMFAVVTKEIDSRRQSGA